MKTIKTVKVATPTTMKMPKINFGKLSGFKAPTVKGKGKSLKKF